MFFIYLTHWQLIVLWLHLVFSFSITIAYRNANVANTNMPWFAKMSWCLQNICIGVVPSVVVDYWALVYDGHLSSIDVHQHGVTLILLILDLSISYTPSYIKHVYQPWIFATIYVIFNYIYVELGGVNEDGENWIYSALDWKNDFQSALIVSIGATFFLAPLLYFCVAFLNGRYDQFCHVKEEEFKKAAEPVELTSVAVL